ncbi:MULTISPECIES: hypothetical protein [Lysinibacillus]|uniref:hypothetical protein n=1 Tax=Lysinibacillus TaxID=400634 RepID=UPI0004D3A30A|nr:MULTISPECIES: hypothetical protein [Lysinibacillus]AJK89654.1 hypothetical protein HR49_22150 [Lysinibacillus fusiformis]KHK54306.1 hypothetical protein PI85_05760 [Lysinibacillus sp. A1]
MTKTNRELATDLTIAVVKARAEIISSYGEGNEGAKQNQLNSALGDTAITTTFEKIYKSINK